MPSRLAQSGHAAFKLLNRQADEEALKPEEVFVRGPWGGYAPDIEPSLVTYAHCTGASKGLMSKGERLVTIPGWGLVDEASLPLGDDSAGAAEAPATNAQAINGLDYFLRSPVKDSELVAITADMGGSENSHIYRLSSGAWAEVPVTDRITVPTDADYSFSPTVRPHMASWPGGVPSGSPSLAANSIDEPMHIIATKDQDVLFWPSHDNANAEADMWDWLIFRADPFSGAHFKAISVAIFGGRACYLNTYETGNTHYPRRMRFSKVADPTDIADATVGAGFVDAEDACEEGLRLEPLGDVLAGYFCKGIVFYTRTFVKENPFNPLYVSRELGLLGTHAMTAISTRLHFGVFEEGWFFINENGEIREAGVADVGGSRVRKWTHKFYESLNFEQKRQIHVTWDPIQKVVRVAFPSGASTIPDKVWLYDVDDDRVWPDDMTSYSSQPPTSYTYAPTVTSPSESWDTVSGDWDAMAAAGTTWDELHTQTGSFTTYHGTGNPGMSGEGYVMEHDRFRVTRNNGTTTATPTCLYESHEIPLRGPGMWKESARLEAEIWTPSTAGATILFVTVDGTLGGDASTTPLQPAVVYTMAKLGGTHHGFKLSVTGEVELRGFMYSYLPKKGSIKERK